MAGCAPSPRAFTAAPTAAAPATQHTHHHLAIAATRQRCIRPSITTSPCSSISTSLLNTTIWTPAPESPAPTASTFPSLSPHRHQPTSPHLLLPHPLTTLRAPAGFQELDKNQFALTMPLA